jgi:hypothetical protein
MFTNNLDYLRTVQYMDDMGELVHHEDRAALDNWKLQNRTNRVPAPHYTTNIEDDDDYYFL